MEAYNLSTMSIHNIYKSDFISENNEVLFSLDSDCIKVISGQHIYTMKSNSSPSILKGVIISHSINEGVGWLVF